MLNSLTDYIIDSGRLFPTKIALIADQKRIAYDELLNSAFGVSRFLLESGVKRGDRVVLAMGNCIETVVCFWGILLADAVVSIIDVNQSNDKVAYIVKDSGAKCFISDGFNLEKNILKDIDDELVCLTRDDISQINPINFDGSYRKKHLDIDLASIIYTSGSTGEPKGVMLTHRNMLAASSSINTYLENTHDESVISVLPLSFDYGLYQMILMVSVGGTLILEKDFLLPIRFLKLIEKYKPTALPLVPSMVPLLVKFNQLKHYELSSIRYVTNTGAALMRTHIDAIKGLLPKSKIFSMYGLTECKRCTYLPPEDIDRKSGSIGLPIPNTEMWIVDSQGNKQEPNKIGEIVVRGQTVMKGYWNKPIQTNKKLKAGIIPGEYVLFTGDFGMMDNDGYFYFHDRIDEVIKSKGIKVSPKEIETQIIKNSSILEVAAVGVEHDEYGQAVVLFVSTKTSKLTKEDLNDFCKKVLQPYQMPVDVFILKTLPKTTNGKINKRVLAEIYKKQTLVEAL